MRAWLRFARPRRLLAAVAVFGLVGAGSVVLASTASAHTPNVTATCSTLRVFTTANYDAPQTVYTYVWTSSKAMKDTGRPAMPVAGTWSHGQGSGGKYTQIYTATDPQPSAPANVSGGSWKATNPATIDKPNSVSVTIDGASPIVTAFATSFDQTYAFPAGNSSNTWTVQFTAWDDPTGSEGWTKTFSGATPGCVTPLTANASAQAAQCSGPGQYGDGAILVTDIADINYAYKVKGSSDSPTPINAASTPVAVGEYTVTATPANPELHTVSPNTFDVKVDAPVAGTCIVSATPVVPQYTGNTCDGTTYVPGTIASPTNGLDSDGITYTVAGNVVTATADKGYALTTPAAGGWAGDSSVQTYTVDFGAVPDCSVHVSGIQPTATPESCTGPAIPGDGSITVTAVEGIEYRLGSADGPVLAGTTPERAGTYTVYAVATGGDYTVDSPTQFNVVVGSAGQCLVHAIPVAPTPQIGVCQMGIQGSDTLVIPSTVGIDYKVDGQTVNGQTLTEPFGATVTVTAIAQAGYVMPTAVWSHTFTFPAQTACTVQQPAGAVTTTCSTATFTFTNPSVTSTPAAPSPGVQEDAAIALEGGTAAIYGIQQKSGSSWTFVTGDDHIVVAPDATVPVTVTGANTYRALLLNGPSATDQFIPSADGAVVTGNCSTYVPPTTPKVVAASASIDPSCPTVATTPGSYALKLTNNSSSASLLFKVFEGKTAVYTTSSAVAAGAIVTYTGTLTSGETVAVSASYSTDGVTWTSITPISGTTGIVCPAVQGEQITKPVVTPVSQTKPTKPTQVLPFTGMPVAQTLVFGLLLIAAGSTLVAVSRRRRVTHS